MAAINHERGDRLENYVDKCYLKETFLKTYKNIILPMNGMEFWETTNFPKLLPLMYSR